MFFGEKFLNNIPSYFPKIFSQIFEEFGQKQLILHDFSKLKKKKILPIWKNWVGHARKTVFSFFVALHTNALCGSLVLFIRKGYIHLC